MTEQALVLEPQDTDEDEHDELDTALEGSDKPLEGDATDADAPAETKVEEEEEEEKVVEKEVDAATPAKGDDEKGETEVVVEDPAQTELALSREQNLELRQLLREQKRGQALLQQQVERLSKRTPGTVDLVTGETVEDEPIALETLQNDLDTIQAERGTSLDTLLETMSFNSKYEDIKDVCTQPMFNDVFEAMAEEIVERNPGKDPNVALLEAENIVWRMKNPWDYMYNLLKEHHPAFQKAGTEDPEKKEDEEPVDPSKRLSEKKIEPAKVPGSIINTPGGGADDKDIGWTAKRIDSMDEDELDEVPPEVYKKFMRGELD